MTAAPPERSVSAVPVPRTACTAPAGPVAEVAGSEIRRLQTGYLADRSEAVAVLARLRRAAGKDVAAVPDLWGILDTGPLYEVPGIRHDAAEAAVYTAATLYALHQQSRRTGMHRTGGDELGAAVRRLMAPDEIDEPVLKRFRQAGSAPALPLLAVRLRGLVLLLRGEDIGLDYAQLAEQLYVWQQPGGRDGVRRSWGRSFHAHRPHRPAGEPSSASAQTDPKDAS
ncbi:type I-E CRISPR-associated protein Cse2/CasB [Streptomyces sanyensis]|uniref:type I-E CRISPR-associated protein Cse2/CasB n=1 Tax=Streptomyces sanyensis TaxID=568869 RepID=UPI003D7877B9